MATVPVRNQICILSRSRTQTYRTRGNERWPRKLAHLGQFIFSVAFAGLTSSCRTNNYTSLSSPRLLPLIYTVIVKSFLLPLRIDELILLEGIIHPSSSFFFRKSGLVQREYISTVEILAFDDP